MRAEERGSVVINWVVKNTRGLCLVEDKPRQGNPSPCGREDKQEFSSEAQVISSADYSKTLLEHTIRAFMETGSIGLAYAPHLNKFLLRISH